MRFINYLLLTFLLLNISCSKFSHSDLIGHWTALSVIEQNKPLEVNHSEITLAFANNGTYYFTSTLNYKEAGSYHLHDEKLITTDTLQEPPVSKTVLVEKLDSDTLRIKMKNDVDWMLLTMIKK